MAGYGGVQLVVAGDAWTGTHTTPTAADRDLSTVSISEKTLASGATHHRFITTIGWNCHPSSMHPIARPPSTWTVPDILAWEWKVGWLEALVAARFCKERVHHTTHTHTHRCTRVQADDGPFKDQGIWIQDLPNRTLGRLRLWKISPRMTPLPDCQ